jgi:hypothetical protein
MATPDTPDTPTPRGTPTAWQRFTTFEPALLRAILVAAVIVAGTVGVNIADVADRIDLAWTAIFAVIPLVQAWWTRTAVTPKGAVVEQATPDGVVIAGEANDRLPDGDIIRVLDGPAPGAR